MLGDTTPLSVIALLAPRVYGLLEISKEFFS